MKKWLAVLTVLVLVSALLPNAVLAGNPMVYIYGRVIDTNARPVESVRLRILREVKPTCLVCRNWVVLSHSVTADRGYFGFGVSPIPGTYLIQFFTSGYYIVDIRCPQGVLSQRSSDGSSIEFRLLSEMARDGVKLGEFVFVVNSLQ